MAYKKSKNYKKRPRRRRRRKVTKRMSKSFKKSLNKIISQKIEKKAETKYLNTLLNESRTFTEYSAEVDQVNHRALIDITPTIVNGDSYFQREGDRVELKSLQLRMRVTPTIVESVHAVSSGMPVHTPYPTDKYLQAYLIRVDKNSLLSAGNLDACIRRPGENPYDTKQESGREMRKHFQILNKFKIGLKYNVAVGLDSSTVPSEMNIVQFPKQTLSNHKCYLNKKTYFNNASLDQPVKYTYKLFITWGTYQRDAYSSTVFPLINLWETWTFIDL